MMPLRQKHCKFYRVKLLWETTDCCKYLYIYLCAYMLPYQKQWTWKMTHFIFVSPQEKMDKLLQFFHSHKHMHFVCLYTQNMLFKFRHNITCLCCLACPICYSLQGHQGYINKTSTCPQPRCTDYSSANRETQSCSCCLCKSTLQALVRSLPASILLLSLLIIPLGLVKSQDLEYSWSLNNEGVGGISPLNNQKSKYGFTVGPPYVRFHVLRFNHHAVLRMRVCSVVSDSLWPRGLQPTGPLHPWDFSGKNAGVGCNFLLQGIFLIKRSNPYLLRLLHWQVDSLLLSHLGSYSTWYACIIYWKNPPSVDRLSSNPCCSRVNCIASISTIAISFLNPSSLNVPKPGN